MTVVIIEPASSGVELVRAANQLRCPVAVLTGPGGDNQACEACRELGATISFADTSNAAASLSALEAIPGIRAILPGMEYYVEMAACLASIMGLPGIGQDVAPRFRNKLDMRRRLAENGVAIPAFTILPSEPAAAVRVALDIGFPAVLKPVDGAGSIGVIRIDTVEGLTQALAAIPSGDFQDLGYSIGGNWMIKSYISGPEFSLEGVVTDAGPLVVAVTEKILGPEPYFVEMGHIVEAPISRDDRFALVEYTKQAIRALGLPLGVFHAEVRLSSDGPRLIEVAARLGGDRIPKLVELASGISLAKLALWSHSSGPVPASELGMIEFQSCAGVRFFAGSDIGPNARRLQQAVRLRSEVREIQLDNPVSASPRTSIRDFRDRVGHVICVADGYQLLKDVLSETTFCLSMAE